MKPELSNISYEDFPYLYLKIKKDAETSFVAKEILEVINKFSKEKAQVNYQKHELTIRALVHILDEIYADEDKVSSLGTYRFPSAVKLTILKYLGIAHKFDDVPELKL
jgi:uncharacterized DUF497 family protein